jgi:long-chain acyl-CoA synthetase
MSLTKYKLIADPRLSMADFWDRAASVFGSRTVALLDEPLEYESMPVDTFTYEDVLVFVNKMGNSLLEIGVKRGDRVVIAMGNRIELLLLCYSCFKIGAIAVPLNYMLKSSEIRYIAGNCGATALVTDRDIFDVNIRSKDEIPTISSWMMAGPRSGCLEGFASLDELLDVVPPTLEPSRVDSSETCAIFYTSGTTGYPKGAMMTSRNLLTTQRITAAVLPIGSGDLGVSALPGAHLMGFCIALICFMLGTPGYFLKYFQPKKVLSIIEEKKATVFVGVPAMYQILAHSGIENYDLSSMRLWASGADAMQVDLIEQFMSYGGVFFEGYGQVETSPITALKLSTSKLHFEQGCVGIPVWPVKTRVWDEECRDVPRGEAGELVVRGPNITKGYWNDSQRNEEAFRGGWFHTGDMARKGKFGLLYFVDRKKDVVKAGGYSVFSKEVEEEIRTHPLVDECAVVGVPHPTKVEIVCAVCTAMPGEEVTGEELLSWCRDNIADYKAPRYVEVRDEMPYGMTLKVLKRQLRDDLAAKLDVTKL